MLMTALFFSPFFASTNVQRGGPVLQDPDIWWHLRNAQVLLTSHHFIRTDLYSFTTYGLPWINHEWLAELPYYFAMRLLSERGVFLMTILAMEVVIAGVFWLCFLRTQKVKAAFLGTWVAVLCATINMGPRAILFGWICLIGELLIFNAFRNGRDYTWWLVPLFALWINLHGSWMIGGVFFALFFMSGLVQGSWGDIVAVKWTAPERRKLLLVGISCVAALFVNPYGWRLVGYPVDMMLKQKLNVSVIEEWQSVSFQGFHGKLAFILLASLLVFGLVKRRRWTLQDVLFVLFAFYAGLSHQRFLFLTGIVVCPIISEDLASIIFSSMEPKRDHPVVNAIIMALLCIFAVRHIPTSASLRSAEAEYFPVAALSEQSRCCKPGRMLNRYEWGGYMIWNTQDTPVFLDSRTDIFEYNGVLADYLEIITMNDSLAQLDRYKIDTVLMPPATQIVYLLRHTPGWHVQYEDSVAVLMQRNGPAVSAAVR